jgi:hypothetical protein
MRLSFEFNDGANLHQPGEVVASDFPRPAAFMAAAASFT